MANDRGRQKKLEKQKKKREAAKKQARAAKASVPSSIAGLTRMGGEWPVVSAHLGGTWRDTENAALVGAIVVRKMPGGLFLLASALIDRTCLGVKHAFVMRPVTRPQLDQVLEQVAEGYQGLEEVPVDEMRSVVFHALDYSASLGFAPHEDFAPTLFGPRPEVLLDTPWARPEKPIFVQGPHDDVPRILAQLEAKVGAGNFEVVAFSEAELAQLGLAGLRDGGDDAEDEEDGDDADEDADEGTDAPTS
jgi:hypothetical protein